MLRTRGEKRLIPSVTIGYLNCGHYKNVKIEVSDKIMGQETRLVLHMPRIKEMHSLLEKLSRGY